MKISVVIPAAPGHEVSAIESLKNQEEKVYEIIIERGKNTSANRNKGAKKAKGDLVAFVNAHSVLSKDWSKNIRLFFEEHKDIDIVGGPQLTPKTNNFFGKVSGIALSSIFGAANVKNRYTAGKLKLNANEKDVTSANLICKRKVIQKVLFDETLYPGEDPKFISDAKKAKLKVAYSPKIVGYNERRESLRWLANQMFKYGKVRPQKEKFTETLKQPAFFIPSIFVIYFISLFFLQIFLKEKVLILSIPLLFYLALDIIFSAKGMLKSKRIKTFFYLMLIYPSIHISYGLGIIWGYFRKIYSP